MEFDIPVFVNVYLNEHAEDGVWNTSLRQCLSKWTCRRWSL